MTTVFIDNKREKKYKELNMTDEKLRQGTFLKKKPVQGSEAEEQKPITPEPEKAIVTPATLVESESIVNIAEGITYAVPSHDIDFGDEVIAIASEIIAEEKAEEEVVQDPKDAPVKKTKGLRRIIGNLF